MPPVLHPASPFTSCARRALCVILCLSVGVALSVVFDGYGKLERPPHPITFNARLDMETMPGSAASGTSPPLSTQRLTGPYPAVPLRIIDGDTVEMRVAIWLGLDVTTRVRLRGIDAPELRARCEAERIGADAAKLRLEALLKTGPVFLTDIGYDKYGTRVVARILDAAHADLGQRLVEEKLARVYSGGKRQGWCDGATLAIRE